MTGFRVGVIGLLLLLLVALLSLAFWDTPIAEGLECDRQHSSCEVFRTLATGNQRWTLRLQDIQRAYVRGRVGPRGALISLELSTSRGDYYVANYEFRSLAEGDAARINTFLTDSSQPRLVVRNQNLVLYIIAFAVAAGILGFGLRAFAIQRREPR